MDGVPCPSCGSKRTTEIMAGLGRPGSIWCHTCGTVTETEAGIAPDRLSREVAEILATASR